jgi:hypothetical protein
MTSLLTIKQTIWEKCKRNLVTLQTYADAAAVTIPITSEAEAQRLLDHINKPRKVKRKVETPAWCKDRYQAAHKEWFKKTYPHCFKDGHYYGCHDLPDLATTNGITTFVQNYITWSGGYANRLNVSGRQIGETWIPSSTKKGTEDIDAMWQGRKIAIEVKNAVTKDTVKPDQVKQRKRIEAAGGVYIIVTGAENFLTQWDGITRQSSIFT